MNIRLKLLTTGVLLTGLVAGCNSISSTAVSRLDSDEFIGESNGDPTKHCAARPFKGIPITLRVPTHVDVTIKEKVRLSFDGDQLSKVETPRRHLLIDSKPVYTAKVFTVDVKRPAAGTANYTLQFGDSAVDPSNPQYFKKIKSRIVDETISDITTALNTITTGFSSSTETDINENASRENGESDLVDAPTAEDPEYLVQVRTVAWKRFDVDADNFEDQLAAFAELHMNGCNSCVEYRSPSPDSYPIASDLPSPQVIRESLPENLELMGQEVETEEFGH